MSDTYPDAAGSKGSAETSREAAEAINQKLGRLQRLVLASIERRAERGWTADECAADLAQERWSIQPRLSELKRKGLIADSGQRRRNVTGKNAVVFVLAKYGEGVGA